MAKLKSPGSNLHGLSQFTSRRRRLILFISPLAIALAISWALGFGGRTVTAQKAAGAQAEAALKSKADFLLRETYRAARALKKQPTSASESQGARRAEDEIRSLSKIIDVRRSEETGSVRVSVAARLASSDTSELRSAGFAIGSRIGDIVTIETDANRLAELATLSSVRKISASVYQHKLNDKARQAVSLDNASGQRALSQTGRGVVVGIIDTGIDFRHGDFIVPGSSPSRTRIKHLWDISDHRDDFVLPGASSPRGHAYSEADINAALANPANPNLVLEKDTDGHGTHVAGTAAGNGSGGNSPGTFAGMAPEADLVIVKATRDDDGMFSSTDIINSLAFIQQKAAELNEPFVINLSLGGHLGPHDGTDPEERAIDNLVNSGTGRAVCVAAGNEQQKQIHADGNLGNGQDRTIELHSPFFDTPQFMILYYHNNDRFSISITAPDGTVLNGVAFDPAGNPVSNQYVDVFNTKDDKSWNEFGFPDTDPANDQNVILIAFKDSAVFQDTNGNPLTSWSVKLHGDNVTSGGHFEAWIGQGFLVPSSSFSHLVASPGNARGAITVGAFITRPDPGNSTLGNITNFSSPGPTADGRQKPEIIAPGHVLASSRSADVNPADVPAYNGDPARAAFTGTSMATPVVAGSIALLLQGAPNLSSDQIKFFITDSADKGFSGQAGWNSLYGFGKLNVVSLFSEAIGNPGDTFAISGDVSNGFFGITITMTGTRNSSVVTPAGGHFSFNNLPRGGNYTVSADALFFHLSPPITINNLIRNHTIPAFSAAAGQGLVAGNVNDATGHNLAGVTITLSKPGLAETASRLTTSGGTNGNYFFSSIAQLDTYVITPSRAGFTFTPASRTFSGAITLNMDFVAVPANPIEDSRTFVRQHYLDFLNREPDTPGWDFWTNNIDSCGGNAACREVKRIDTSAAYFLSMEFQQTGYLVHRFYKASFGRRPLFTEFMTDTRAIGNGVVVNAPGWEQLLASNTETFKNSWVTRPAFTSIYSGLNNTQYVDALIANTGVTFSPTDRNAFIDVLENTSTTRAEVLRLIAEYEAFFNAEYNAAFVEMQYFGYLRRNPQDPPNTDLSGFNFWLNKLNQHGGDFRKAEMVKAFLVSSEYRQRFGTP